jgi:hypothetical protein
MNQKPLLKRVVCVLYYFDRIIARKFVQIHMNTTNIVYYIFLQLNIQYEYSTTLILHKTSSGCFKNYCLNKLIVFYVTFVS